MNNLTEMEHFKTRTSKCMKEEGEIENAFDIENLVKIGEHLKEKRQRNDVNSSIKQRNAKMKSLS